MSFNNAKIMQALVQIDNKLKLIIPDYRSTQKISFSSNQSYEYVTTSIIKLISTSGSGWIDKPVLTLPDGTVLVTEGSIETYIGCYFPKGTRFKLGLSSSYITFASCIVIDTEE